MVAIEVERTAQPEKTERVQLKKWAAHRRISISTVEIKEDTSSMILDNQIKNMKSGRFSGVEPAPVIGKPPDVTMTVHRLLSGLAEELMIKDPPVSDMAVSAASGYLTGYVLSKLDKGTVAALGGAGIILTIGVRSDCLVIKWENMGWAQKMKEKFYSVVERRSAAGLLEDSVEFVLENPAVSACFASGLMFGMTL